METVKSKLSNQSPDYIASLATLFGLVSRAKYAPSKSTRDRAWSHYLNASLMYGDVRHGDCPYVDDFDVFCRFMGENLWPTFMVIRNLQHVISSFNHAADWLQDNGATEPEQVILSTTSFNNGLCSIWYGPGGDDVFDKFQVVGDVRVGMEPQSYDLAVNMLEDLYLNQVAKDPMYAPQHHVTAWVDALRDTYMPPALCD